MHSKTPHASLQLPALPDLLSFCFTGWALGSSEPSMAEAIHPIILHFLLSSNAESKLSYELSSFRCAFLPQTKLPSSTTTGHEPCGPAPKLRGMDTYIPRHWRS